MRSSKPFDHQPWWMISVKPDMEASFRRWNWVVIWSLAFVVASVFAMTLTAQPGHAAFAGHKIFLKIDRNPSPLSLAEFKNGHASVIGPAFACRGEHFRHEGGQTKQRPWFFLL